METLIKASSCSSKAYKVSEFLDDKDDKLGINANAIV